ncbi:MAG: Sapep family Mn(2+)-dependent dipeptidase [Clostridia bacterium]
MREIEILEAKREEIVKVAQQLLRYNTVKQPKTLTAPFGQNLADCLDFMLKLCAEKGGRTQNFDNYCGHADFGCGEEIFGMLGHLDVVPADEDNWISSPFSANIINGKIYARGALDDKTPILSCLYAILCLQEAGYNFNKRARLIFGCDEESGMECMKYYLTKVAPPTLAISPDGDFPVINREKGIMTFEVNCGKLNDDIISIVGGARSNVVMDKCVAKIKKIDISKMPMTLQFPPVVEIEEKNDCYILTTKGVSAHGASPQEGENASWKMFATLANWFNEPKLSIVSQHLCDYTGKKWGVDLSDELSGALTANIGIVRYDGELKITVNVRHPITYTNKQVTELFMKNDLGFKITLLGASEPLYVDEKSYLVQKLLSSYKKATGKEGYTIAIGGGTYSRHFPNCVAFGPEFPGETAVIHQPNECISIDRIMEMTRIYMEAIKEICCEP